MYTIEANEELENMIHSKQNFIDFGCKPLRASEHDVVQSIYCLTKVLRQTKLTDIKNVVFK